MRQDEDGEYGGGLRTGQIQILDFLQQFYIYTTYRL